MSDIEQSQLPPPPPPPSSRIERVNIEDEMRQAYLDYSMSVIIGRALPDVRDGLKPVHRRILYAMFDQGQLSSRRYSKCAGVVGEVLKKYHPHGDAAVYDALVRLAQEWNLRYPLIDGQGNFGSVDGDPAAAYRYTECRLTPLAEAMLADIEKDTVNFVPNFDESTTEPVVLPTRFPNLLVNGADGIAVGMATKIPPHNMREVVDACVHLIDHPDATVDDLCAHIQGPDFPTAGMIMGRAGIEEAYKTGRGKITVRGRHIIETDPKTGRESIVFTEIPYQVNKARLLEGIAKMVKEKKIEGISDLRDESDREGMRVVIDLKRDAIAGVVLNNLFAHTELETTMGLIMLSIDGGQPRVLDLRGFIDRFIAHRREVVTRRSRFELRQAEERLHIVEGLLVAQDFIDLVIALIRASSDAEEAKWGLMRALSPELTTREAFAKLSPPDAKAAFAQMRALVARVQGVEPTFGDLTRVYAGSGFSEAQAKAILEMRLSKLTNLERGELVGELAALTRETARLREILANEKALLAVIKTELIEIKERFGDARRTEIVAAGVEELTREDLIPEEDMVVTVSHAGYAKRNPKADYRAQRRGGKGVTGAAVTEEDFVEQIFVASTHAYLLVFSEKGKCYWLKVHQIPQAGRAARGKPIVNLVQMEPGEKVSAILPIRTFSEGRFIVMVTRRGIIKRVALEQFSNPRSAGIIALQLEEGDRLVGVAETGGAEDILVGTASGMAIRFRQEEVRPMGRTAYGVYAIDLEEGDQVVGMEPVHSGASILTVTENGYGKRTLVDEYRLQGRGGKGVIDIKTTERNGKVVGLKAVTEEDEIMVITAGGILIRTRAREVSLIGRNTQGVRIVRLESENDKVVGLARLAPEPDESSGPASDGEDAEGERAEGAPA